MKKMVLAGVFVLLVYGQAFAQSGPIMGYDKVKWGTSVLDVRKAYNLGTTVALQERYDNDPDVAALVQQNVSDSIKRRIFLFNKWKGNYHLYRVWVIYWDDSTANNLLTGLATRYGDRTDFKQEASKRDSDTIYTETTTFGKYSPDLVVELFHVYGKGPGAMAITLDARGNAYAKATGDYGISEPLQVCYTWKKFRDEFLARNVEY